MDESSAIEIVGWAYEPPYDIYNHRAENAEADVLYMLDGANGFYSIRSEAGELVAFCSFGGGAQVPGGAYGVDALDIGLGLRPDLTGRGMGVRIIDSVLEFAGRKFRPVNFRVTIAAFNARARKAWMRAGFSEGGTFRRTRDGQAFGIFIKTGGDSRPVGAIGS
jgi:ribosomal-protein-alanine N-acetyltransferase